MSVRSRIEREQERPEETPTPSARRIALTSNPTASTRERADAAAYVDDPGKPLAKGRATGLTSSHVPTTTSVRFRLDQQAAEAEAEAPTTTAADHYYRLYQEEQRQKKIEAEAEEQKRREQIERRKRDEQIEAERRKAAQTEAAKNFVIDLALNSVALPPATAKRVKQLAMNLPEEVTVEKVVSMAWKLSEITKFNTRANEVNEKEIHSPWKKI